MKKKKHKKKIFEQEIVYMLEVSFSGPISCELGIAGNWNGNEPLDFIFNSGSFPCPGGACIGPITKLGAGGEVYVYGGAGIFGIWEGSFGGHWGFIGCILEGSESMILWQAGDANDRTKTIMTVVFIWGICCQYWWQEILEVLIIESIVRQSKIPPSIWCSWFTAMVMMRSAMVIRCSSLYCQRSWINAIATWTWLNIITAYHNTYSTLSFEYHHYYLYIIIHIPPYIE